MDSSHTKLVKLFRTGRAFICEKDDIIVSPGDTPSGVYYIASGSVKAYSLCRSGEPNIITTLGAGEVFPLTWAFHNPLQDIGFGALDTTTLWRVSRETFLQALEQDKVLENSTLLILAQQYSMLLNEVDNLRYRSAREKVVFRLLCLANQFGEREGNRAVIKLSVPNEYIARSTNMTRETASREVSRLARKQLIQVINGRIIIPDRLRLRDEISKHFNPTTLHME